MAITEWTFLAPVRRNGLLDKQWKVSVQCVQSVEQLHVG